MHQLKRIELTARMRGQFRLNEKAIRVDGFPCDSQSLASLKSPFILKNLWIRTFCIPAGAESRRMMLSAAGIFVSHQSSSQKTYTSLATA
jgi:hypothetical protein